MSILSKLRIFQLQRSLIWQVARNRQAKFPARRPDGYCQQRDERTPNLGQTLRKGGRVLKLFWGAEQRGFSNPFACISHVNHAEGLYTTRPRAVASLRPVEVEIPGSPPSPSRLCSTSRSPVLKAWA